MLKLKLFTAYIFLKAFFFPLHQDVKENNFKRMHLSHSFKKITRFSNKIPECSGLCFNELTNSFYTLNDGGSPAELFQLDSNGVILGIKQLAPVTNTDWETITTNQHAIFIGDVGNNNNDRKDLSIYKYDLVDGAVSTINIHYSDQKAFPPAEEKRNFDCEAMFHYKDSLYLISKNRGQKWVKIYSVPDKQGTFTAYPLDSILIQGHITGASVCKGKMALLSYGPIYFFDVSNGISFKKPLTCQYFKRAGQSEAISWNQDGSSLYIANENRRLYKASIKQQ